MPGLMSHRALVPFGLVAMLLFAPGRALGEGDVDAKLQESERDLGKIEGRVDTLIRELGERREDRRSLIAELEALEKNVAELALANRELERLVAERQGVATELRARQREERRVLAEEVDQLADLLRTAYVMGRADRLRLLLNQEDPTQASRVMSYFAYFNRERLRRILGVQRSAARLAALALAAAAAAARLAELARSQEATRQQLVAAKEQRAEVLAQLEATIQSRSETLDVLNQDAESLKLLIKHLRQRAQISAELDIDHDPFPARKGRLAWPILEGRILAGFGTRKEDSDLDWDGVLLAAEEGEEVKAVSDGRVLYADWLRGFGLLIVLDHGDGYMTLYGHNEALLREVGEWVSTGEPIALTGNSGGRAEPVLYFAVRKDGRPQDPAKWCAGPSRHRAQLDAGRRDLRL
ncbi:murein hydrolase activator EnvC family protein [Thiorhodococcus minor]|nr:peptidoglycan DD-metalloendopeptidase family protein [Thiorhodococcus minor]